MLCIDTIRSIRSSLENKIFATYDGAGTSEEPSPPNTISNICGARIAKRKRGGNDEGGVKVVKKKANTTSLYGSQKISTIRQMQSSAKRNGNGEITVRMFLKANTFFFADVNEPVFKF